MSLSPPKKIEILKDCNFHCYFPGLHVTFFLVLYCLAYHSCSQSDCQLMFVKSCYSPVKFFPLGFFNLPPSPFPSFFSRFVACVCVCSFCVSTHDYMYLGMHVCAGTHGGLSSYQESSSIALILFHWSSFSTGPRAHWV